MSDPIEVVTEEALRPGRQISEHASFSLVNELQSVAVRIARADPERTVGLYETFIAACPWEGRGGQLARRVAVIAGGAVIAEGTPDQLKSSVGGEHLEIVLDGLGHRGGDRRGQAGR